MLPKDFKFKTSPIGVVYRAVLNLTEDAYGVYGPAAQFVDWLPERVAEQVRTGAWAIISVADLDYLPNQFKFFHFKDVWGRKYHATRVGKGYCVLFTQSGEVTDYSEEEVFQAVATQRWIVLPQGDV